MPARKQVSGFGLIGALLCSLCCSGANAGAPTWTLKSSTGPRTRDGTAMVYDAARGKVILFGGQYFDTKHEYLADTWAWDGTGWTQVASAGPSARSDHGMAYDSARQRVVLFGGTYYDTQNNYLGDTWEWNGTAWTQIKVTGPPPRAQHSMAYNNARGTVFAYSGDNAYSVQLTDTWEWNGTMWTPDAASGPGGLLNGAMAYDSARGRLVLFGGDHYTTSWARTSDTWEWEAPGQWMQHHPATHPDPRHTHAMAYDPDRGTTVMFGGYTTNSALTDTWEWNGTDWSEMIANGPSYVYNPVMAYDASRHAMVLWGWGNTYEYAAILPYTLADVQRALQAAGGKITLTSDQKARLNVVTAGTSASTVDSRDAVLLARKVAGLEANP